MTFRILAHQIEALGQETRMRFIAKMAVYVVERLPQVAATIGEAHLEGFIASALAVAHEHGIETEPEAAQLVLLLTVLGLDAPRQQAWVGEILTDGALLPVGKLKKIVAEGRRQGLPVDPVVVYDSYLPPSDEVAP